MTDPKHPSEIDSHVDAVALLDELDNSNIDRFETEGLSLIIEGNVDYWNHDDQRGYTYRLRFEASLDTDSWWISHRQSRLGHDEFPEDWTEVYSETRF